MTKRLIAVALVIVTLALVPGCASAANRPIAKSAGKMHCSEVQPNDAPNKDLHVGVVASVKRSVSDARLQTYEFDVLFARYSQCFEEYDNIVSKSNRTLKVLFYGTHFSANSSVVSNALQGSNLFESVRSLAT